MQGARNSPSALRISRPCGQFPNIASASYNSQPLAEFLIFKSFKFFDLKKLDAFRNLCVPRQSKIKFL